MCEQYKITLQDSGIEMVITLTPFHELLSVLLTHYHCVADAITFLYWHDGPSAGHYETLKPGHEIKNVCRFCSSCVYEAFADHV